MRREARRRVACDTRLGKFESNHEAVGAARTRAIIPLGLAASNSQAGKTLRDTKIRDGEPSLISVSGVHPRNLAGNFSASSGDCAVPDLAARRDSEFSYRAVNFFGL
jgi:hypothetical protein